MAVPAELKLEWNWLERLPRVCAQVVVPCWLLAALARFLLTTLAWLRQAP